MKAAFSFVTAVSQVVERHISRHFHLGIGGGDQLYALSSTPTPRTVRPSPWSKVLRRRTPTACNRSVAQVARRRSYNAPPLTSQPLSCIDLIPMSGAKGLAADFSPEMEELVRQFYFKRCLMHFHSTRNQSYAVALSSIPFVNTWDDHDIFDGFGSYDDDIQVSWVCVSVCVCVLWNMCLCAVEYVSLCCGICVCVLWNMCLCAVEAA